MFIRSVLSPVIMVVLVLACNKVNMGPATAKKSSADHLSAQRPAQPLASSNNSSTASSEWKSDAPVVSASAAIRPHSQILCEDGPKVTEHAGHDDFSNLFKLICEGGRANAAFDELVRDSYRGSGTQKIKVFSSSTTENFVTYLTFGYSVEMPLPSPSAFGDLKVYDDLARNGIANAKSRLNIEVESRTPFPGKGSVEAVLLKQGLAVADGAALFDRRPTEINNYLLIENIRDLTLSTEHLVDPDTNQYYHIARGMLIGMKSPNEGSSNLIYVNELVIKNRIDPDRVLRTIMDLAAQTQRIMYKSAMDISK